MNHRFFADDTQLFASFTPSCFSRTADSLQTAFSSIASWMSANFLSLNTSKTEFMVFGTDLQLAKLDKPYITLADNTLITPVSSARNLGFIFDKNLSLHEQITSLSKSCFFHIKDLRRIRPNLDLRTASIIATSLVHSKLDYCNSLYLNLPSYELDGLQYIQNSLARSVTRSSRFSHVSPTLKSLHWLKVRERILYKTISLTYKVIESSQPLLSSFPFELATISHHSIFQSSHSSASTHLISQ